MSLLDIFHNSIAAIRQHEEQMAQLSVIIGNKNKCEELAGIAYTEATKTTIPNYEVVKLCLKKMYQDACAGKQIGEPEIVHFVNWLSSHFRHSWDTWILMPFDIPKMDYEVLDMYNEYNPTERKV